MYNGNDGIFSHHSDVAVTSTAYYQNISVTSALIGEDNAIVNRWGGYLYRDNYYFSICKDMEHSRNSGTIRYGYNMIDIDFTADYSNCLTMLIATDNYGNRTRITNDSVPNDTFPHHICKSVKLSYDDENKFQFLNDAQNYFDNYKQAAVNIKITFADLSSSDIYSDYIDLANYEVGDRITVYHKELDISYENLMIISKKYDVVNNQTLEIEIGSFKDAIIRDNGILTDTIASGISATEKQLAATQNQLDDVAFATYITTPIATSDNEYLITSENEYVLYKG